ncbi:MULTISPECIES: polyribonucleotide nucleotidyltransferase [unclassified Hydrogenobaculum]|uniref:polyribonucleotide nucleotidyltransferase n=1 Tax=unclassified Hydrogenobaculum TaxID=2622382 RepID=UPI0001C506C9|nr:MULTISPECIES: polyribonucleotide nucleotidyltransferase [unclassified Hydrogenobaculum]AEF18555.1 polyribonucleotide nucleotidyltransferase [Hydrogenobaculum sp. 3684]AEG45843.1 Polyribonucleotide nucleotidyltransferase [Hydrogenobaculum sp. SHO]AGG14485.1 polyribonucleotide nucleotidyltransferase [Hydrogenobaculum sp. HO]AGH92787.1 polyribonucleotide nucleotidyltransferase [Hydrogenobaculum sp. SN]
MMVKAEIENQDPIYIEANKYAHQADSSILISQGDTKVLITVCVSEEPLCGIDFAPLSVDYRERSFAWGKIPGGFIKREGKPTDREVLVSRVIDRPLRPLVPKGFLNEIVVTCLTLSADDKYDPDVLAITGASAALMCSSVPFEGPVAGMRVCRVNGEFIINPTYEQRKNSDIDIIMAISKDAIVMVEGGAKEVEESVLLDALFFGLEKGQTLIKAQEELVDSLKPEKKPIGHIGLPEDTANKLKEITSSKILEAFSIEDKKERSKALKDVYAQAMQELGIPKEQEFDFAVSFKDLESQLMREQILKSKKRIDGRKETDIRPITIEMHPLERPHGSAVFTRGQTQALATVTLAPKDEAQLVETIFEGETFKRFMLHYNFPPFSTGEARPWGPPRRREIGHGALAERALEPLLPKEEDFPYIIRVVSDILESNGSSSMATVCAGSLALFDAGVPMKKHVAGIAMGLIKDGDNFVILTDILGDEDHLGDMDFKVAGTRDGVTSVQMDIKIKGLSKDIMVKALNQAKEARMFILDKLYEAIPEPNKEVSKYAPKAQVMKIPEDKVGLVIGPAGKNVKYIKEQFGASVWIDGANAYINAPTIEAVNKAVDFINSLIQEVEVGGVYEGKVIRVENYGLFVEVLPGKVGLLHASAMTEKPTISVGDTIKVKVMAIDEQNRLNLCSPDYQKPENQERPRKEQPNRKPHHRK